MAAELDKLIAEYLSQLPQDHSDRPHVEAMLRENQRFINRDQRTYMEKVRSWDTLAEDAKQVLEKAAESARSGGRTSISAEDILIGATQTNSGITMLTATGKDPNRIRGGVEWAIGHPSERITDVGEIIGLTPGGRKVLELARDEARTLKKCTIDTRDLIVGLALHTDSIAAGIMGDYGVTIPVARRTAQQVTTS